MVNEFWYRLLWNETENEEQELLLKIVLAEILAISVEYKAMTNEDVVHKALWATLHFIQNQTPEKFPEVRDFLRKGIQPHMLRFSHRIVEWARACETNPFAEDMEEEF